MGRVSITFEYAAMPFADVSALASANALNIATAQPSDSYRATDSSLLVYRVLLSKGFRWVRTDGDLAIFEKKVVHG